MASIREMRGHIKSIKSIGQMTRALQAVSASRVRSATRMSAEARPYTQMAGDIMDELYYQNEISRLHPIFKKRDDVKKALILFVSADRGLAGSFPMNIFRKTLELEKQLNGMKIVYCTVGKKGRDMLLRRKKKVVADFSGMTADSIHASEIITMTNTFLNGFYKREFDEVYIVYTEYESASRFHPAIKLLMPITQNNREPQEEGGAAAPKKQIDYIFEGDPHELMDALIPRVVSQAIFHAILSSRASEHTARMIAMSNATENAETLQEQLRLEYNKVRQQMITNDILDIVGGAEALSHDMDKLIEKTKNVFRLEE